MSKNFNKTIYPHDEDEKDLRVILFVSRNKDNKDIEFFKERKQAFLAWTYGDIIPSWVKKKFDAFVNDGQDHEVSRLYMSLNARDPDKIKKALIINFIENPENIDLQNIEPYLASIAAKIENKRADQRKWLFDVDYPIVDGKVDTVAGDNLLIYFLSNLNQKHELHNTPHGWAVVTEHGFDNREFKNKVGSDLGSPKKDAMLFREWRRKI